MSRRPVTGKPARATLRKRRSRARLALDDDPARFYLLKHRRKHAPKTKPVRPVLTQDDLAPLTWEDLSALHGDRQVPTERIADATAKVHGPSHLGGPQRWQQERASQTHRG